MACFSQDDGLFSPVRFDHSLADSSNNSGESITSMTNIIQFGLSFKDTPHSTFISQIPDVETDELKNVFSLTSGSFNMDEISTKSSFPSSCQTTSKDLSTISVDSKKLSTDLKRQSLNLKRMSKDKSISSKENSNRNYQNQPKVRECKEKKSTGNTEQKEDIKIKKPVRSTLLLPLNKASESSGLKDVAKIQNKASFSKTIKNTGEISKKSFTNTSGKGSLNENSAAVTKDINAQKSKNTSGNQTCAKRRTVNDLQNDKSGKPSQRLEDTKRSSHLLLQSEDKVIEKMVRDYTSLESDKIRQNIYSQQMSLYRQLNKLKDNMQHQHLATTDRLCKMIEELVRVNVFLKESG